MEITQIIEPESIGKPIVLTYNGSFNMVGLAKALNDFYWQNRGEKYCFEILYHDQSYGSEGHVEINRQNLTGLISDYYWCAYK